jgi:activator of Hsp90 ATPase-like protein
LPDKPENHHTVTIELSPEGKQTHVSLTQDNNASEQERAESEKNWEMMLTSLKKFVEQ